MPTDTPKLISHIPNSGIVQMPGRRFPGIVMQGDTLFNLLSGIRYLLQEYKRIRDEERYYEALTIAETLYGQLQHYEETLKQNSMTFPYSGSVTDNPLVDDYEK